MTVKSIQRVLEEKGVPTEQAEHTARVLNYFNTDPDDVALMKRIRARTDEHCQLAATLACLQIPDPTLEART